MWICFKETIPEPPNTFKLPGVWIQDDFKWNNHIEKITKKANKPLFHLRECRRVHLTSKMGLTFYETKIRHVLECAAAIWGRTPQYLNEEIENIQGRRLRIVGLPHESLPSLMKQRDNSTIREYKKILKDVTHPCNIYIPKLVTNHYGLRMGRVCPHIFSHTKRHELSFLPRAISLL